MERRRIIWLLLIVVLTLVSCEQSIKFEKDKWEKHIDGFYPYRSRMIDDLLQSTDFDGKQLSEIFELLGEHDDWCDHNMHELRYQVLVDYGRDIDPVHTKYLVFELNRKDSVIDSTTVVTGVRIDEWKK